LIPKQKYFQTVSRIGGYLGSLVDIRQAPLVFNLFAIAFQILPATFFLSGRFKELMPKFYLRFLISLGYLLILGAGETHANLTNVQWRLALLMFLIIIVPESKKIGWKIFDSAMLLLAGLSGPFVFFALPLAGVYFYFKSFKKYVDRFVILLVTFSIQIYSFLFIVSDASRSTAPLGASFSNFFKILAGDVFVRGILGVDYMRKVMGLEAWENSFIPVIFGIFGIFLIGYVFWKARLEVELFIIFSFLILAAGMASPQVSLVKPQWDVMKGGSGGRYYFFPTMAWMFSLGWIFLNAKNKSLKKIAAILIFCWIFVGLPKDWAFDKYKNFHFDQQVSEFKSLQIGQPYTFKIAPKWEMTLSKK
jgi:hypothetical protein